MLFLRPMQRIRRCTSPPRLHGIHTAYDPNPPAFAFDIDGVLIRGKHVLDAAKTAIARLFVHQPGTPPRQTHPLVFLTNGGGVPEHYKAEQLAHVRPCSWFYMIVHGRAWLCMALQCARFPTYAHHRNHSGWASQSQRTTSYSPTPPLSTSSPPFKTALSSYSAAIALLRWPVYMGCSRSSQHSSWPPRSHMQCPFTHGMRRMRALQKRHGGCCREARPGAL